MPARTARNSSERTRVAALLIAALAGCARAKWHESPVIVARRPTSPAPLATAVRPLPGVGTANDRVRTAPPAEGRPPTAQPVSYQPELIPPSSPIEPLPAGPSNQAFVVDLATALRLGGASNLQIELARQRTVEAQLQWKQAKAALLPDIWFGLGYNRHDGRLQETIGNVLEIDRQSLFVGGGAGLDGAAVAGGSSGPSRLVVNLSLADAHFEPLVRHQLYGAAVAGQSQQTQDMLRAIAVTYFDVLQARSDLANNRHGLQAAQQMVQLTTDFFEAGQGAQAEVFRAETQRSRWQMAAQDSERRVAGATAELARLLRLDPQVRLVPADTQLVPVTLVDKSTSVPSLVATGLAQRPELARFGSLVEARLQQLKQETYRPLVPYIQLGAGLGSFGGGPAGTFNNQGGRSDIDALAVWELSQLGYGNLLMKRQRATQLDQAELEAQRVQDQIVAEIITAAADAASYRRQIETARQGVVAAGQSYELNLDRIRDAVGLPLELDQAIRARTDAQNALTSAISNYNRAQYRLLHALGQPVQTLPSDQR